MKFNNNKNKKAILGVWWPLFAICVICGLLFVYLSFEKRIDLETNSPISDALIIKAEFELIKDNVELIVIESISQKIDEKSSELIDDSISLDDFKQETYNLIKENVEDLDGINEVEEIGENGILTFKMSRARYSIHIESDGQININYYFGEIFEQIQAIKPALVSIRTLQTSIPECTQVSYDSTTCNQRIQERINTINSNSEILFCSIQQIDGHSEIVCNAKIPPYFKENVRLLSVNRADSTAQIERVEQGNLIRTNRDNDNIFSFGELNFPDTVDGNTGFFIFYSYKERANFLSDVQRFEQLFLEREGELNAVKFPDALDEFEEEVLDIREIASNGPATNELYFFDIDTNSNVDFFASTIVYSNTPDMILNDEFDLENNEYLNILIVDNKIHQGSSITQRGQLYTYPESEDTTTPAPPTGNYQNALLFYGTNDHSNPNLVYTKTKEFIQSLKNKGYNVITIPPNPNAYESAYNSVIRASSEEGIQIINVENAYSTSDPLHLTNEFAAQLRTNYESNSIFVGDSNAVRTAGYSSNEYRQEGAGASQIEQFILAVPTLNTIPTTGPQ